MKSNVWCAWWRKYFNPDDYLYHYTSFETALKILYSNKFQFSPLSKTNDTSEQKLRITYNFDIGEELKKDAFEFEKYWSKWTSNSKLLCFSLDRSKSSLSEEIRFNNIFDMRGRGFALPRMWAQYGSNNSGVCFIVRKKSFVNEVENVFPEAIYKKVSYIDWLEGFKIEKELFTRLSKIIKSNPDSGYAAQFLIDNPEFTDYTYFSKLKDWESECEFRILLPNSNEKILYLYLEGVKKHLAGIVLGEYMDDSQINAIKTILPSTIPIRRIVFELSKCFVENVSDV